MVLQVVKFLSKSEMVWYPNVRMLVDLTWNDPAMFFTCLVT